MELQLNLKDPTVIVKKIMVLQLENWDNELFKNKSKNLIVIAKRKKQFIISGVAVTAQRRYY